MNAFLWFASAILVENVVLSRFLGTCPFLGVSKNKHNALGMGITVTFVIVVSTIITWLIYNFLLIPLDIAFIRTIIYVLIIASLVQIIEIITRKFFPSLHQSLGIYLPLIATNCAVLGVTTIVADYSFLQALIVSLGSGIGFLLVIYIFSSLREKLEIAPIPKGFKGVAIALITAGIMAMIISRFAGVI